MQVMAERASQPCRVLIKTEVSEDLAAVVLAVREGHLRATVPAIRTFRECSQTRASMLRRELGRILPDYALPARSVAYGRSEQQDLLEQ